MKDASYYKGRASVWKELWVKEFQRSVRIDREVNGLKNKAKGMSNTIDQLEKERDSLQMKVEDNDRDVEVYKFNLKAKDRVYGKYAELLGGLMSDQNCSDGDLLRHIRTLFQGEWEDLKRNPLRL